LVGWLVGWTVGWLVRRLVGYLPFIVFLLRAVIAALSGKAGHGDCNECLLGSLIVGWLVGLMVGWAVGWLSAFHCILVACYHRSTVG
jgi:hypothetical protein